jgi:hypothetical protein
MISHVPYREFEQSTRLSAANDLFALSLIISPRSCVSGKAKLLMLCAFGSYSSYEENLV